MEKKQKNKASKFLSLVLRHKPETINLKLDGEGWVNVSELLTKLSHAGTELSIIELIEIVDTNEKKRFAFNSDKTKIRASQGHSVEGVDLNLSPKIPPVVLFHGTAERNEQSIFEKGLLKGERHHVHLSEDLDTAKTVGRRYSKDISLFAVDALEMNKFGYIFYQSDDGVWLTDHVPPGYLSVLE